ncbi:uncharacterized protein LOC133484429 isoform X2 [Phyllopteryx taeniolatus]|uniref:uncharacterized protein LOC133484429 isoform X2 n=1 Tax=Phyllopteryx taeniolatus TaxID=161469 RepID=UPI002AD49A12|nr:uncharacterized protein LOC133484429 isoform X2 [Phyllopteryx taeniolatus]
MDVSDENMTSKEMLEKVAELDHSRSQLKLRNTEMRHLLDAADDEMTVLRSENEALRKQVKTLEQMIVDVQHVEAQPFRLPLGDDLYLKQSTKFRQQELKEHNAMMEQNKNLIAEVQRFQEQREKDMMSLSKFSVALKNSEFRTEEAQIGLQQRDEVIQQNKLQLKQAEETIEEYSSIIKDLRLANQELRTQLEDTENEASLATLSDFMGEKQALPLSRMSFAEEVKLLAEIKKEEIEAEEPTSPPIYHQTSRCTQAKELCTQRVFVICVAIISILVILAAGSHARNLDFLSVHNLWRSVCLTLDPYFSVQYGALPPI